MPASLFNTLPPAPVDPATTVRAPSLGGGSEGTAIIMPPLSAAPLITTKPPGTTTTTPPGEATDRDTLLYRLRERRRKLTPEQIAALLKLVE